MRAAGTKWITDGTPIERQAFVTTPYADRPGFGTFNFAPDPFQALLGARRTGGMNVLADASLVAPFLRERLDPEGHVDPDSAQALAASVAALAEAGRARAAAAKVH